MALHDILGRGLHPVSVYVYTYLLECVCECAVLHVFVCLDLCVHMCTGKLSLYPPGPIWVEMWAPEAKEEETKEEWLPVGKETSSSNYSQPCPSS